MCHIVYNQHNLWIGEILQKTILKYYYLIYYVLVRGNHDIVFIILAAFTILQRMHHYNFHFINLTQIGKINITVGITSTPALQQETAGYSKFTPGATRGVAAPNS